MRRSLARATMGGARRSVVGLMLLLGPAGCAGGLIGRVSGDIHRIPLVTEDGDKVPLTVRLCRPPGPGPFPVAVVSHAGAANDAAREAIVPAACSSPPAKWFLSHGYIAVFPLRRGYGDSLSNWAANPGGCSNPDYVAAGLSGARDLEAAVGWATALPFAKPSGVVLMGEGEGGWAGVAYASRTDPRLAGAIVIAGGMGGRAAGMRQRSCRPDLLVEAASRFGRTSRVPMLWIAPTSDPNFSPELSASLYRAFTAAGAPAHFEQPTAPPPSDAGWLLDPAAAETWMPRLERFVVW